MRVRYDPEVDALRVTTETPEVICQSLWDPEYHDIVVDLATEEGLDIVGLDVMWASAYLPLGKRGYDAETDILLMGRTATEPELIRENGDIIGYWERDEDEPNECLNPIGVAIKRASVHLGKVIPKHAISSI